MIEISTFIGCLICLLYSISVSITFQHPSLGTEASTIFIALTFFSFLLIESHPGFLAPVRLVPGSTACLSFLTLDLTLVNRVHASRAQSVNQQTVPARSSSPRGGARGSI